MSLVVDKLNTVLDPLSNGEGFHLPESVVEKFKEDMGAALVKQFGKRDDTFKLRPSNLGKPKCQLWHEARGYKGKRRDPNFVVRMLIGDAVEAIVRALLTVAEVDVTSDGDKVQIQVGDALIKGESDLDIGGKVYDVKSAAPSSFPKFLSYEKLEAGDSFGYRSQLALYADAQDKKVGGWLAVNKSTGQIKELKMPPDPHTLNALRKEREEVVEYINSGAELERCFEPEEYTHYRKPTGEKVLSKSCDWCDFVDKCYPNAELRTSNVVDAKTQRYFINDD